MHLLRETVDEISKTNDKLRIVLNLFFQPKQRQKLAELHQHE